MKTVSNETFVENILMVTITGVKFIYKHDFGKVLWNGLYVKIVDKNVVEFVSGLG